MFLGAIEKYQYIKFINETWQSNTPVLSRIITLLLDWFCRHFKDNVPIFNSCFCNVWY